MSLFAPVPGRDPPAFRQARRLQPTPRVARALFTALLVVGSSSAAHAQEEDDGDGWTALPVVAVSKETGLLVAGYGLYYFRMPGSSVESRPSQVALVAGYTTRGQLGVQLEPELYLDEERWLLAADLTYRDYPTEHFGVGNDARLGDEESFELGLAGVAFEASRRVVPSVYVGVRQDAEHVDIDEIEPGGMLDQGRLPGSDGGWISGLGLFVRYDDRDNTFDARTGGFYQASATRYDPLFGSDYGFTRFEIDLRKYDRIVAGHGVALRALAQITSGGPPFTAMPELGGPNLLRGIYAGRYRDDNLVALEAEYRFPIYWRFRGAVFGGFGEVASGLGDLTLEGVHPAAGAGIRFHLDRAERVNLRLDAGFSPDDFGIYLTVGEAF